MQGKDPRGTRGMSLLEQQSFRSNLERQKIVAQRDSTKKQLDLDFRAKKAEIEATFLLNKSTLTLVQSNAELFTAIESLTKAVGGTPVGAGAGGGTPEGREKLKGQITNLGHLIQRDGATADTLIELALAMDAAQQDPLQVFLIFQQALQYRLDPEICRLMAPFIKERSEAADVDRLEALQKHAEGLQAFRANRLELATTLLEAAAPIAHQRQAESNFFLGECLWHLDRRESALEAYRRCLELRPHHGRAAERVERIDRKGEG